jgi:hypothetical protein
MFENKFASNAVLNETLHFRQKPASTPPQQTNRQTNKQQHFIIAKNTMKQLLSSNDLQTRQPSTKNRKQLNRVKQKLWGNNFLN